MGWANGYIQRLKQGETIQFRPRGNSMTGKVNSGQLVTVVPLHSQPYKPLAKGDIVLCKVRGREYLHLVKALRETHAGTQYQIGNNLGGINGWVTSDAIYGRCIKVEA